MTLSDQDCILRCRNGCPDDYRHLVERYQGPLVAFVAARLNDSATAEEVAEEAFVRAFFRLEHLKNPAAFQAWLFGIAARVAMEFQRARFRRNEHPASDAELAAASTPSADEPDHAALHEAITALPEQQRELILLRYFRHCSCQEIAARLELPLGTVTKTLSRAYAGLRELIVARENNPAPLEETR